MKVIPGKVNTLKVQNKALTISKTIVGLAKKVTTKPISTKEKSINKFIKLSKVKPTMSSE